MQCRSGSPGSRSCRCSGASRAEGTLGPNHTGTGALYTWYPAGTSATPGIHYRWTWGTFSAAVQSFNWGKWHSPNLYHATVCGDCTMNGNSGVALVNRSDVLPDANLEVFMPHGPVADCGPGWHRPDTVHAPHADAEIAPTSGRPIADLNDYPVIASWLCRSLSNPFVSCPGAGLRSSEVPEARELVVCEGIR